MRKWKSLKILIILLLLGGVAATAIYVKNQSLIVQERLASGAALPPWEIYSKGFPVSVGRPLDIPALRSRFAKKNWRERNAEQSLLGSDFKVLESSPCAEETNLELNSDTEQCLLLNDENKKPAVIGLNDKGIVVEIWQGEPLEPTRAMGLIPDLVAQLAEGQPILKKPTSLGDIPLACLQAVTAIEDSQFLEHRGVSPTGILRAMARNLRSGRFSEGGSTITQQLVKNFILTSEKTMSRKVKEQLMALLVEGQATKDTVLEMYLNVIYMGQNGPYQVRGIGSAAEYYFEQKVSDLNLAQCALLAAVINSPGRYSPWDKAEAASKRRHLVLQKMLDLKMISQAEFDSADAQPLPSRPSLERKEPAPYFINTVVRELESLNLPFDQGLKIYTSLDPELQAAAAQTLQSQVPLIEANVKSKHSAPLQSSLISVDLYTSEVLAIVGGKDFRSTQFNRVLDARRQIGSVIKPFVYWPALKIKGPAEMVDDSPFEWKQGSQKWSPKNYEGKANGAVPMFWALAQSLNIATARLGQEIGLEAVIETLKNAGLESTPPALPSLTLGALEISPWQVAQLYTTLANFGEKESLHTISQVQDQNGIVLYKNKHVREQSADAPTAAAVVGMLKLTPILGTARALKTTAEKIPLAGKTGTTSDTKDAWFVGFTPRLLTIVWVGFDDNTAMGLTGASAALPIWNHFFQQIFESLPNEDFKWPENTVSKSYNFSELIRQFPALSKALNPPESIELILPED